MPFEPRVKEEILQEMTGQTVAQSPATGLDEGGVITTALGAMAEGIEAVEFRLAEIRDSYDIDNAVGTDLDERIADFPGESLTRLGASPSSGDVLTVVRDLATTPSTYVLPAGSRFGRSDDRGIEYVTVSDESYGAGVDTVTGVRLICLRPGEAGNAPAGSINRIVSAPDGIISITQTLAIAGGTERESDDELRARARAYLSSLARSQPAALQLLALSFTDSLGLRAKHASVFEDLFTPAYAEVVVDDGTGFSGFIQTAVPTTGTIPVNGALFLNHQSPATAEITSIKNTTTGTVYTYLDPDLNPTWKSIPERGLIQLKVGQTDFAPGDSWEIGGADTSFQVYTGFIQELQDTIEGSVSTPTVTPGYRAAGSRVRVVPPDVQTLNFKINVVLLTGAVVDDVIAAITDTVQSHLLSLAPGQVLFLSQLYTKLQQSVAGVEAFTIIEPSADFTPLTARKSLRAGNIEVI